jgi:hypothetical protein
VNLAADCSACAGLCCVGPAFAASAEFAIDKAAGHACPHLGPDSRCGIHDRLLPSGFGGCVAYDCFGAGQRIVALRGPERTPATFAAYDVLRQLHELLFYVEDALGRAAAAPVHADLRSARDTIEALDPGDAEPGARRAAVAPLLRRASALVRGAGPDLRGADLVGRELAGADLRRADLSTAYLIGADLRGADLREADLLGADLRGADLAGADLSGALYLTRTQVGGARGDAGTRSPLPRPAHWLRAGSSAP